MMESTFIKGGRKRGESKIAVPQTSLNLLSAFTAILARAQTVSRVSGLEFPSCFWFQSTQNSTTSIVSIVDFDFV